MNEQTIEELNFLYYTIFKWYSYLLIFILICSYILNAPAGFGLRLVLKNTNFQPFQTHLYKYGKFTFFNIQTYVDRNLMSYDTMGNAHDVYMYYIYMV